MIVTFGTYDAARHPRIGVIIEGLRAHGQQVVEVNRPLGFTTAERVRMLQQPWRLPLLLVRLVACWAGLVGGAARARRAHGAPRAVVVGYMGHFDVLLARVVYPRTTIVLDHLIFAGDTATDRGAAGLRVRLLRSLDRLAIRCADVVVTDTEEHRQMLPDGARGLVVPVGAPAAWFDAGDRRASFVDGPLRVAFFGLYTPLQGAPVIGEALRLASERGVELEVTMVGTGQDLAATKAATGDLPHVSWLDWVAPDQLPALVADHDVCLGIFSDTPKGLRVVPNKVYQGIAAGCVVVTSDTAPQRRQVGEHAELVHPADPAALAERLAWLADREHLAEASRRSEAGRAATAPGAVVEPLVEALA
ncbi:MAG: glycosyltransferase [Promicromonosporaceae bacterium]|nr:glycosyltransferase [Promicromonosporaceae bacterium]